MNLIFLLFVFIVLAVGIIILYIIKRFFFPKKQNNLKLGDIHTETKRKYDVYHHHEVSKNVYVHRYNYGNYYDYSENEDKEKNDDGKNVNKKEYITDKALAFGAGAAAGYTISEYGEDIKEKVEDVIEEGKDIIEEIIEETDEVIDDITDYSDDSEE